MTAFIEEHAVTHICNTCIVTRRLSEVSSKEDDQHHSWKFKAFLVTIWPLEVLTYRYEF